MENQPLIRAENGDGGRQVIERIAMGRDDTGHFRPRGSLLGHIHRKAGKAKGAGHLHHIELVALAPRHGPHPATEGPGTAFRAGGGGAGLAVQQIEPLLAGLLQRGNAHRLKEGPVGIGKRASLIPQPGRVGAASSTVRSPASRGPASRSGRAACVAAG